MFGMVAARVVLGLALGLLGVAVGRAAPTYATIHDFSARDGVTPTSGLLADGAGGFYGTTTQRPTVTQRGGKRGTVYHLTPPDSTHPGWTTTVLHVFRDTTESYPGTLIFGKDGALYGSTQVDNVPGCYYCGTVFRLAPPAAGQTSWHFSVLANFDVSTGYVPAGPLLAGEDGTLYGVANVGGPSTGTDKCPFFNGCGTVFEVSPPAPGGTAWTMTVLHSFDFTEGSSPATGLTGDPKKILYGTTAGGGVGCSASSSGCGTVFQMQPPAVAGGAWSFRSIYRFQSANDGENPQAPVSLGADGALYGTTSLGGPTSGGEVYRLTPPTAAGGAWTKTALHVFEGFPDGRLPYSGVAIGPEGGLYGTTDVGGAASTACGVGCGTVFQLHPPHAGSDRWIFRVLHTFTSMPDGAGPSTPGSVGVTLHAGSVFGTAAFGGTNCGAPGGCGTVFEVHQ